MLVNANLLRRNSASVAAQATQARRQQRGSLQAPSSRPQQVPGTAFRSLASVVAELLVAHEQEGRSNGRR